MRTLLVIGSRQPLSPVAMTAVAAAVVARNAGPRPRPRISAVPDSDRIEISPADMRALLAGFIADREMFAPMIVVQPPAPANDIEGFPY